MAEEGRPILLRCGMGLQGERLTVAGITEAALELVWDPAFVVAALALVGAGVNAVSHWKLRRRLGVIRRQRERLAAKHEALIMSALRKSS